MFRCAAAATALLVACLVLVNHAESGQFNQKLKIGDAAPIFTGLESTDGKSYSLDNFKDKDVLVVCITCNHCPVAVAYEERIVAFNKKYCGPDGKVGFVAINVNNNDADKLPRMKERAKERGFNFAYAYDPSQKVGRDLGASVTPEFFVYNKSRQLVYMGSMDDSQQPARIKNRYLEAAVEAALKGETPATAETRPFGCSVQYERKSQQ